MQLLSIRIERSLNILSLPASASILDLRRDDPFELLFLDYSDDATPPKLERRVYLALCGETLPEHKWAYIGNASKDGRNYVALELVLPIRQ